MTSTFLANTTVNLYRGSTTDALDDEGDDDLTDAEDPGPVNAEPVPFSLIERSRKVYLPESNELRTIRYGIGRCKPTLDVRKNDRIRDLVTGRLWVVNEVSGGGRTIAGHADLSLDLRAV